MNFKFIYLIFWGTVWSINSLLATDDIASIAPQDIKIVLCKGFFTGKCSWDEPNTWDLSKNKVNACTWRKQKALTLQDINRLASTMNSDKYTNFSMFRMQIVLPRSEPVTLFDCHDKVFASGGDKKFLGELESKLGNKKFVCSADYWNLHPYLQEGNDLRQNIAEIMGFNESLTAPAKRSICEMFKSRIMSEDYLEEVVLNNTAVSKLVSSCWSSLSSVFDDSSDRRAHNLGLVDYSGKIGCDWHVNDLFGESFQLNFAHSGQVIRQFISCLDPSNTSISTLEPFLKFDEKFLLKVTDYKSKYDASVQAGVTQESAILKQTSTELDKFFVDRFHSSGAKFVLEIASNDEICSNCWATFRCEFLSVGAIQKKFLLLMINSYEGMPSDLKWYITERLCHFDLAKKIPPIVSLVVSSR